MGQMRRLLRDTAGQDMIEYALMVAFLAVSAGAFLPGVNESISQMFSRVGSSLGTAVNGGS
jgi:Flp pilus assembly pilin Flp